MDSNDFDFVVFESGGKQHFVKPGGRISLDADGIERIDKVLLVKKGDSVKIGNPFVDGASVELEFVGGRKGEKLVSFKKKRRKGYKRKIGHRQKYFVYALKNVVF